MTDRKSGRTAALTGLVLAALSSALAFLALPFIDRALKRQDDKPPAAGFEIAPPTPTLSPPLPAASDDASGR